MREAISHRPSFNTRLAKRTVLAEGVSDTPVSLEPTDASRAPEAPQTRRVFARAPAAALERWRVPGWVVLVMLAVATLVSRVPFLTPRLAHWDAVNYALGLHDFNVAAHQPHPPGSPYFILLGRAALAVLGDDNSALIAISLLASTAAVLAEYALAGLLFGRRAGVLAALVLLSQPVFWGYGTMGMPWTLLACLALLIGVCCLKLLHGQRWLVFPSALLLGLTSGFRLDATVFLGPLWLWTLWRAEPALRRRLLALGLVVACVLLWLVPVAASSGGPGVWFARLTSLLPPSDVSPGPATRQLAANTAIAFGTLGFSLGPAVLLSLVGDWRTTLNWLFTAARSASGAFWILWTAPAFVFLWLIDSTEPGHSLVFSVALCAIGAGLLVATYPTLPCLVGVGGLLVACQIGVFVYAAPQFDRPLAWTANAMLLNVTAPGIRQQQASLDDALQTIRTRFDPADSVVLTVTGQDAYRFMMYYLPTFPVLRLDPAAYSVLAARDRRQGTWTQPSECVFGDVTASRTVRHAVWVLASNSEPGVVPAAATLVSSAVEGPFQVWEAPPAAVTSDYLGFKLGGDCAAA